jgi:hypothetical protein
VFFFLARQRLPRDVRAAIFNDKRPREPRDPNAPPSQPKKAALPPLAPRRRVFEVVPASKPASSRTPLAAAEPRGPWPPVLPEGSHVPAELADAATRAKVKQGAYTALAALNPSDQYLLLIDMLGELHAQHGGEVPRPSVDLPRSERKPTGLSQPPTAAANEADDADDAEEDEPTPSPAKTPAAKTPRTRAPAKTAKTATKARSRG